MDRERQADRQRQTDRHTDRQTQVDRQTDRQKKYRIVGELEMKHTCPRLTAFVCTARAVNSTLQWRAGGTVTITY